MTAPLGDRPLLASRSCLFFLLSVVFISVTASESIDSSVPYGSPQRDSSFEEYDFNILDPNSALGVPFGGFGRATRSRLAALPLYLPEIVLDATEETEEKEPEYMEVTDAHGARFVCRTYQEDELEPASLKESMFHPPRLQAKPKPDDKETEENPSGEDTSETEGELGASSKATEQEASLDPSSSEPQTAGAAEATITADGSTVISTDEMDTLLEVDHDSAIVHAHTQLSELRGVCGQIHKGWWSFEWCFETTVSQFHVQVDKRGAQVRVEDVSSLGSYNSRTVIPVTKALQRSHPNNYLHGRKERVRVVDEYREGKLCEDTGRPCQSFVHMMCCADQVMEKTQGLLHRNGKRLDTGVASVASILEGPTCSYNITVCTPLLCVDDHEAGNEPTTKTLDAKRRAMLEKHNPLQPPNIHPESRLGVGGSADAKISPLIAAKSSVREILQMAMGGHCLQSDTGAWWVYELCHGGKIRQFHEAIGTRKTSSGGTIMSKTLETENILGHYDETTAEAFPGEDWRFVVNATAKAAKTTGGPGNGAYFELEYTDGDICDHPDVTDAAIIAGSTGSGGIARASSVRYSCGSEYSITVNEDSTCHYIVQVTVPELCQHPLFMAPVAKKQVVKCLPVDE